VGARAARLVSRAFDDALSQAGGSLPAWLVLLNLKIRPTVNQRELAEAVGIREATLTHHLNAMETDGLLTRRRDHNNRRIHVVELTDAGEGGLPATPRRRGRVGPAAASRHHRRGASQLRRSARPARRQLEPPQDGSTPWGGVIETERRQHSAGANAPSPEIPEQSLAAEALTAAASILVETDPPGADSTGR
jgi:DNA-binding HxlR family transcriptional regulator